MVDILSQLSGTVSKAGTAALKGVSSFAGSVLTEGLANQLFDNYVPLEKYTEYQRTYNWEVVFPFQMGGIPGMVVSKYCKAVVFGDYNIKEIIELQKGPKSQFAPGTMSINNATMIFLVPCPNLLQGYFTAWKNRIISPQGHYYPQDNYKCPVYIRLYTTQGITSGSIKLKGVFPTTFPDYNLSYETETVVRYTLSFSVDDMEFSGFDIGSSLPRVLKHIL